MSNQERAKEKENSYYQDIKGMMIYLSKKQDKQTKKKKSIFQDYKDPYPS